MGADIIGWRTCDLQRELGPAGFLGKLKLRTYKSVIERMVPPEGRAQQKVSVVVNGPEGPKQRSLTYATICAELDAFDRGIPECASCPLSGGAPLGCYHFVQYPIDAAFERLAFDFFVAQVDVHDSIANQLYRDVVSRVPAMGTGWHTRRGSAEQGGLAELPRPLEHKWGGFMSQKRVDSAQILQALFIPLEHPALIVGYTRFWVELLAFAKERGVSGSPTLEAAEAMVPFWAAMAAGSVSEGWTVQVDG
jgi:hypothetical protein